MSLRTVNPYTSYRLLLDFQRTKDQIAKLEEQIASGNRLTRLGDDPTASALVLDFQNSIEKNQAYIQQANSAASFLQTTETCCSSLNDSLTRLLELGPQALSTSTTASGRTALAQEIDGIRTTILSLSNTQTQGKYIFAGTATTTQPFSGPAAGPITYAGNSDSIDLDVAVSASVTTNLTGTEVFFGGGAQGSATDVFQQVTDLRDALLANNAALIQTSLTNLRTIFEHNNTMLTELGGRQRSLDQLKENIGDYNLSLQSIQSSYQALDYPAAAVEYQQAQNAQQASLSVLAQTNNLNLFDYLG